MKTMATSLKRSQACTATLSAPNPAAGHCRPSPPLETLGHPQASPGQSFVGSLLLSPGSWCTRFCLCPPRVYFPVLCKFWRLYGGLMATSSKRAYAIPRSAAPRALPCSSPLLTCSSSGDSQTQFCLSLCGVPGSCTQGLFEPSEHLWQKWGLILNANSPLLPSFWGFSFALGYGVSPHSLASATQPLLAAPARANWTIKKTEH